MAVLIGGVRVVVEVVVPVDVVDFAVAVVIDAVARHLVDVDPEVLHEIGVGDVGTGVDDRDREFLQADVLVPRLGGVDPLESVHLRIARIVRNVVEELHREHRLDELEHVTAVGERLDHRGFVTGGLQAEESGDESIGARDRRVHVREDRIKRRFAHGRAELREDPVRDTVEVTPGRLRDQIGDGCCVSNAVASPCIQGGRRGRDQRGDDGSGEQAGKESLHE